MSEHAQACRAGAAAIAAAGMPANEPVEFVRRFTDELREPLKTVQSIAFYLEMVLPRTEVPARRQLGRLRQEIRLVNWILADAIDGLQPAPLHLQLLDLSEVVSRSLSGWPLEETARVSLRLETGLAPVWLDVDLTGHMLRGLMAFAGRIAAPDRSVAIRTRGGDRETALEIGAAIDHPYEEMAPLQEPAGVRRIVAAHDARMEFHSGPASVSLVIAYPVR